MTLMIQNLRPSLLTFDSFDINSTVTVAKYLKDTAFGQSYFSKANFIEGLIKSEVGNSRPNKKERLEQLRYFCRNSFRVISSSEAGRVR